VESSTVEPTGSATPTTAVERGMRVWAYITNKRKKRRAKIRPFPHFERIKRLSRRVDSLARAVPSNQYKLA